MRFAWREAHRRLHGTRATRPLFRDARGAPSDFADAATLVAHSFVPLGRGDRARAALRTGDILVFRQVHDALGDDVDWHLMLVVVPEDPASADARVVYHPGERGAAVRTGTLRALSREAPHAWRPTPENAAFLGYFRASFPGGAQVSPPQRASRGSPCERPCETKPAG